MRMVEPSKPGSWHVTLPTESDPPSPPVPVVVIWALGGPLATIPIIALTANAFPEDVRACFAAGMNQFVAKPVSRETLLTALLRALSEETATDQPVTEREIPAIVLG